MIFNGVFYEIINVLVLLMNSFGPTPVAGFPGGTTAALLNQGPQHAAHATVTRLK